MNGSELRATLTGLGLAQAQFARLCRQTPVTVHRWLSGVRKCPSWLEPFLAAYGMLTPEQRERL